MMNSDKSFSPFASTETAASMNYFNETIYKVSHSHCRGDYYSRRKEENTMKVCILA
jgi:hypothetical protein